MEKQPVSMLRIAVRDLQNKSNSESEESDEHEKGEMKGLEQAMADFKNATSDKERAAAFKAALELAKAD